jgi:hypothetical protein
MIWKHQQNIDYLVNASIAPEYVRATQFHMDREIFNEERDGFEYGFVGLVVTLHVDAPGLPPLFPVGVEIDDESAALSGTIYYYGAFEIHRLGHLAFKSQQYHDNETFAAPPAWLGLKEAAHEAPMDEDAGPGVGSDNAQSEPPRGDSLEL